MDKEEEDSLSDPEEGHQLPWRHHMTHPISFCPTHDPRILITQDACQMLQERPSSFAPGGIRAKSHKSDLPGGVSYGGGVSYDGA